LPVSFGTWGRFAGFLGKLRLVSFFSHLLDNLVDNFIKKLLFFTTILVLEIIADYQQAVEAYFSSSILLQIIPILSHKTEDEVIWSTYSREAEKSSVKACCSERFNFAFSILLQ
jgi:hypothetical protein